MRRRADFLLATALALAAAMALRADSAYGQGATLSLDQSGQVEFAGRMTAYRVRNLPVSSFPDLPRAVAAALAARGCVIPQTYQAKRPENVIHGSLERAGSSDWAVLCSANGKIALLVFFGSGAADSPATLSTSSWTLRLQPHGANGELGFDWGIDPASPSRIHDAQASMRHRPPAPEHDAVADSTIDGKTTYRLYRDGVWETVPTE
jgi:hypothetical protein